MAHADEHATGAAPDPLTRPVFVVGPPSSGQVAMRETLLRAPGTWTTSLAEVVAAVSPVDPDPATGDHRTAASPHGEAVDEVRRTLVTRHRDAGEDVPHAAARLVSAEPVLALWVPFLDAVFPDATFVYLHRDPEAAVAGALAEWQSGSAVSHPDLPQWDGLPWSLPLVPGWPDLQGLAPEAVVAAQWAAVAHLALDDLESLDLPRRWFVDTADLVRSPDDEVQRLFTDLDLGWHPASSAPWRALARTGPPPTVEPSPDLDRVRQRVRNHTAGADAATSPGEAAATEQGLGEVLRRARSSLLVSTYQSNRLMVLRHDRGALGVHLRSFDRPMGIAVSDRGFALGTRSEVWDFRDLPAAARGLEPHDRHDACYLPRNAHVTGDIAVHELEVGRDGLWVVATRFSCLATLDADHSFVPRWMPPFVSAIAAEDRCHLNGMALVDGEPRWVTALGTTDTPGGWREDKVTGGVVVDVPSGEVVVGGLAMPHSPRWHDGRLWVLESGRGRLSVCDPERGTTEPVVELPGFTRGLRFHGTTAFVGTSQIRETATFGGLPIASLPRRECGVWAVDTTTGTVLGSVRFESRIQEIFDVAVVAKRFPEVAETTSDLARDLWSVPPLAR